MSPEKNRSDYVEIRLTAAGEKLAGGDKGALTYSNRHMHYTFRPGEAQEVVSAYEWTKVLSNVRIGGELVFELADGSAAPNVNEDEAAVTVEDAHAGI
jgi:hypothetical protein